VGDLGPAGFFKANSKYVVRAPAVAAIYYRVAAPG